MSFFIAMLNYSKKVKKLKNTVGSIKNLNKKQMAKLILSSIYPVLIEIVVIVLVVLLLFYSITGAVSELFNKIIGKNGSSSNPSVEFYDSLSESEIAEWLEETGANLNPKKISSYMKKANESVPSSITGTKVTEKGESNVVTSSKSENIVLNTSNYVNLYKLNWEFIAAIDLALFQGEDASNDKIIKASSDLFPVFDWNTSYSEDTTNYEMVWDETYEYDPTTKETVKVKDTLPKSEETFTTVKVPLAIPDRVSTLFGDYKYSVTTDKTIINTEYSSPFEIDKEVTYKEVFDKWVNDYDKPIYTSEDIYMVKAYNTNGDIEYKVEIDINTTFDKDKVYRYIGTHNDYYVYESGWWIFSSKLLINKKDISSSEVNQRLEFSRKSTESIFTGKYEQKKKYKTITITKKTMKKTKKKVITDIPNYPSLSFDPTTFIKFLNDNELSVDDIELIREILLNIPNSNSLLENIDRIYNGDYGDIMDGRPGGVISAIGGFNFYTPLFIQWDERWGSYSYAGETIGVAGCAPTSMAMVLTGLGANISIVDTNGDGIADPKEVSIWSTKNGYAANMQGSYDTLVPDLAKKTGLTVKQTYNSNDVYKALKEGKVVVSNVTPGTIINGNHFLVLTGVNADGTVAMNDPYSKQNSEKGWSLDIIKKESRNFWIIDNPNANVYDESLGKQDLFIAKIRRGSISSYYQYGVLPSVTIAQGIEESGWGESSLASKYNNLFGIKADSSWKGEKVSLVTGEYHDQVITAYFRVYNTWSEGIYDHALFIYENTRYAQNGFFKATDYKGQTKALQDAGYATLSDANGNPIYSKHLNHIIESYELNEIDDYVKKMN